MVSPTKIKWTAKQREAFTIMRDPKVKHFLMYGGARSGKTYVAIAALVTRALAAPGSRHLAARLRFAHAKLSLWMDTLPKVLHDHVPANAYRLNETDHYVKFANGSELWIDGLDDKDRVDKILGREYSTIFLNEISQIAYDTVTTVQTRLSQNICRNLALYDCNPGGRQHWAHKIFVERVAPDGSDVGSEYAYLIVNPEHNKENLPEGYIEDILGKLPEHKRNRFLLGLWTDPEGTIFSDWDTIEEVPEDVQAHAAVTYGLDFGFSVDPAVLVKLYYYGSELWIDEMIYQTGLTNQALGSMMRDALDAPIYADSAEPKSIEELRSQGLQVMGATKGPDSVRVGIDWLLSKTLHVTARSQNLINELANYTWKVNKDGVTLPQPIDDYDHAIDATRYGCSEWIDVFRGQVADYELAELGL